MKKTKKSTEASEIISRYSISGYYLLNNQRGNQEGKAAYFSDGKIVGELYDSNAGTQSKTPKLVLGAKLEDGRVGLVKIADSSRFLYPVLWLLRPLKDSKEIEGNYIGRWQFFSGIPMETSLGEFLRNYEGIPPTEGFKSVSTDEIKKLYFSHKDILNQIQASGSPGEIVFSKLN